MASSGPRRTRPERATSVSSHREAAWAVRRRGSYVANGVLHPPHMIEPGQEGYRTPTGEDFNTANDPAVLRQRIVDRLSPTNSTIYGSSGDDDGDGGSGVDLSAVRSASQGTVPTFKSVIYGDDDDDDDDDNESVDHGCKPVVSHQSKMSKASAHTRTPMASSAAAAAGPRSRAPQSSSSSSSSSLTHRQSSIEHRHEPQHPHVHRLKCAALHLTETAVLGWRQRLRHFTWSYFTITMATGGIANVLWHVPFPFHGQYQIGLVFFLMNVVFFAINIVCITLRFVFHPSTLRSSFVHPTESLFAPAAIVSFGTILMNITQYGTDHVGTWLDNIVMALFWVDVALAMVASFGIYLLFWQTQTFTIATMTPIWIFPAYPLLIIGPHAAALSRVLTPRQSAQVLVGGFTAQGIGLLVSMMIYSAYIYRLMTQKLPLERLRPGMFVSVGPSAFTAAGLSNMAANAHRVWDGSSFMDDDGRLIATVLRVVGDWTALWFWGLALWFFFVAVGANLPLCRSRKSFPFAMTWYSFVFPQTALTTSTFAIGRAFDLQPVQIIGCIMAVATVAMWFFVTYMMFRAIYLRQILWPQRGEDRDEGGFRDDTTTTTITTITTPAKSDPGGEKGYGADHPAPEGKL